MLIEYQGIIDVSSSASLRARGRRVQLYQLYEHGYRKTLPIFASCTIVFNTQLTEKVSGWYPDFTCSESQLRDIASRIKFMNSTRNIHHIVRDTANYAWIDEIICHLGLLDKENANMRTLSGGMKRRVLVAQALVHKPPVIILDEPTAGVDVELRQSLWHFIKQLNRTGHTIVLTTHYLDEAEALCGRVAMLKQGKIVALDSTKNLINSANGCLIRLRLSSDTLPSELQPLLESYTEGCFVLRVSNYSKIESVLAALRIAQVSVLEMELMQPDLKEVFIKIMGNTENLESV